MLVSISILFGASCWHPHPIKSPRNNTITSISFAAGGCYRSCPEFAMEIDSDLHVTFYGERYCKNIGFYRGNISPDLWDSVNMRLEHIHFADLDSVYDHSVDDLALAATVYVGLFLQLRLPLKYIFI
jgi:hypothetical protein